MVGLITLRQGTQKPGNLTPNCLVHALTRTVGVATQQQRHSEQTGFALVLRQEIGFLPNTFPVDADEVSRWLRR